MFRCSESNCEEKFDNREEFTVHISYHEYHQKIKDEGKKELELLEKRFNKEINCPLADNLEGAYYFPQLPNRLVCEWFECRQQFLSAEKFYEHVSNHAHRLVDRCYWDNCTKNMKRITLQILREHLRVHTLQKLYACPYCGNFFSTKIKFDDHFLRHLPLPDFLQDKDLIPNVTNKKDGNHKFDIEEYDVDGDKVKIFRCVYDKCGKAFLTSSLLREHIRIHSNTNQCNQCEYVAKSSSRLKSHQLYRHQDIRNYTCTICLKAFKQRGDLRAHVRRHQIIDPRKSPLLEEEAETYTKLHDYCCHLCYRVFSRGNNLSRHLKDQHKLPLPVGQSRFRYKLIDEGVYILDTEDETALKISHSLHMNEQMEQN